ncbi:hypothetical protein VP01_115g2 [Puccinia sorghi]|uniref:Uncharacterized protein n=1 Tax=Puccinia sorghi TaxID=27349 RepID=A0A0L6VSZ3_9BASI|nr:hypothetical protein VP01_115g2 [Puccinia sorghi]
MWNCNLRCGFSSFNSRKKFITNEGTFTTYNAGFVLILKSIFHNFMNRYQQDILLLSFEATLKMTFNHPSCNTFTVYVSFYLLDSEHAMNEGIAMGEDWAGEKYSNGKNQLCIFLPLDFFPPLFLICCGFQSFAVKLNLFLGSALRTYWKLSRNVVTIRQGCGASVAGEEDGVSWRFLTQIIIRLGFDHCVFRLSCIPPLFSFHSSFLSSPSGDYLVSHLSSCRLSLHPCSSSAHPRLSGISQVCFISSLLFQSSLCQLVSFLPSLSVLIMQIHSSFLSSPSSALVWHFSRRTLSYLASHFFFPHHSLWDLCYSFNFCYSCTLHRDPVTRMHDDHCIIDTLQRHANCCNLLDVFTKHWWERDQEKNEPHHLAYPCLRRLRFNLPDAKDTLDPFGQFWTGGKDKKYLIINSQRPAISGCLHSSQRCLAAMAEDLDTFGKINWACVESASISWVAWIRPSCLLQARLPKHVTLLTGLSQAFCRWLRPLHSAETCCYVSGFISFFWVVMAKLQTYFPLFRLAYNVLGARILRRPYICLGFCIHVLIQDLKQGFLSVKSGHKINQKLGKNSGKNQKFKCILGQGKRKEKKSCPIFFANTITNKNRVHHIFFSYFSVRVVRSGGAWPPRLVVVIGEASHDSHVIATGTPRLGPADRHRTAQLHHTSSISSFS